MNQHHSVLVIGCGSIGERHLRCFLKTNRVTAAVCDTNTTLVEEVAKRYGVPGFDNLDAAHASFSATAWVICTPAHTHLPLALRGLKLGLHVLIEKPLSIGLDGVAEIRQQLNQQPRHVAVAYVYHVMPFIAEARAAIMAGAIGTPVHATVVAGQHFPSFRPTYRDLYYAHHETGGGAIQDGLTHQANFMEWMLGPVTRVFCDAAHQVLEGVEVEDTVNLIARHGPVMVSYAYNQFQGPNESEIGIHGTLGSIRIEVHQQLWGLFRHGDAGWTWQPSQPAERDDHFVKQANEFLEGIEGRASALATFDEAIQTLKFNLAALESARTGRIIEIA